MGTGGVVQIRSVSGEPVFCNVGLARRFLCGPDSYVAAQSDFSLFFNVCLSAWQWRFWDLTVP